MPGPPVPKGRPKFVVIQGRVSTYTPKPTQIYEALVAFHAQKAMRELRENDFEDWDATAEGDYELLVQVYRHQLRGDADNFHKAVSDGLNKIAYPDDRFIFRSETIMKLDRENPRVNVAIRRWPLGEFSQ